MVFAVSVSLQGPRRRHDLIRGKGSYDRALKGINNALNAGLPVHIFTTVGRSMIPDLPGFAERVFGAYPGIEQLTFIQLIRVPEDVFDLSKEVLSPDDFLRLVRMISLLNLYGLKVDLLNNPLAVVASKVLKMPWVPRSPPLYRPGSLMITAELRITLAHSTTDHFGIYKPGILPKIISSDDYCRAVSQDRLICRNCVYSRLCSQEGMLRPSEWYRDMFPRGPLLQESTGQGLVVWVTLVTFHGTGRNIQPRGVIQAPDFSISCEQREILKPGNTQDHSGFSRKGGEEMEREIERKFF